MKNLVFVHCNNPEKTLKDQNVYGIKLTAVRKKSNSDLEQIGYLHRIHSEGFKTFAKIVVTSIAQAYGQFINLPFCDFIYVVKGKEVITPGDCRIFVQKVISYGCNGRIYLDKSLTDPAEVDRKRLPEHFSDKRFRVKP